MAMNRSLTEAADNLASLDSVVDRMVSLDLVVGIKMTIVQYVDDNAVPTSSCTQSAKLWGQVELYSDMHGPTFTIGVKK